MCVCVCGVGLERWKGGIDGEQSDKDKPQTEKLLPLFATAAQLFVFSRIDHPALPINSLHSEGL